MEEIDFASNGIVEFKELRLDFFILEKAIKRKPIRLIITRA